MIAVGAAATLVLGVVPGPVLDLARRMRDNSSGERQSCPAGLALPVLDERLADAAPAPGWTRSRRPSPATSQSRARLRHRGRQPPDGGRRQAVPAAAGAAGRRDRRRTRTPTRCITAACVVELTHLASLYHDDVMDEADLRRGADVGQRPLGQPRRDPHRRLPVLEVLRADRRARARRRPHPGADVHPPRRGPDPRDARPGPGEDPLEHYLRVVAGKTGSLIATSARYGARCSAAPPRGRGGADGVRREGRLGLPALRRHPRHRLRVRGVRQDARHRPARGRADAARADRPAVRPTPRTPGSLELLDADLDDDDRHAEALAPAARPPRDGRGPRLRRRLAAEAKALLKVLPEGPVRDGPRGLRRRRRRPLDLSLGGRPRHSCPTRLMRTPGAATVRCSVRRTEMRSKRRREDACPTKARCPRRPRRPRPREAAATEHRRQVAATAPPPPGGGYGGGYGAPPGAPPPNHLVWAILSHAVLLSPAGHRVDRLRRAGQQQVVGRRRGRGPRGVAEGEALRDVE